MEAIRIDMCHNDFGALQMRAPIELIKSNGSAVQLMNAIEIFVDFKVRAI